MAQWCAFFKPDTLVRPQYAGEEPAGAFTPMSTLYPNPAVGFQGPPQPPCDDDSGDDGDGYDDDYEDDADATKDAVSAPAKEEEEDEEEEAGYGDDFEAAGGPVAASAAASAAPEEEAYEDGFEEDDGEAAAAGNEDYGDDVAFESPAAQPAAAFASAPASVHTAAPAAAPAVAEVDEYEQDAFDEEVVAASAVTLEPSGAGAPDAKPPAGHQEGLLRVGDLVEARFGRGASWYAGKVTAVHGGPRGKVNVAYDDGDFEAGVKAKYVRRQGEATGAERSSRSSGGGGGQRGGSREAPAAFAEEEMEEVVAEEEVEEQVHARLTPKQKRRAVPAAAPAATPAATQAATPAAASAVRAPPQNANEAFDGALACMEELRAAMAATGQSADQLFAALARAGQSTRRESGGDKGSSSRQGLLSLAEFRQGCQALFGGGALDLQPVRGLAIGML